MNMDRGGDLHCPQESDYLHKHITNAGCNLGQDEYLSREDQWKRTSIWTWPSRWEDVGQERATVKAKEKPAQWQGGE